MRLADEWKMFGDMPGMPVGKPQPGEVLLIVAFAVLDAKTGKPNTDESFRGFALIDAAGASFKAIVETTDLREIAFSVPPGTKPKTFDVGGLTFDVSSLRVAPKKP
jgi:hypothetical protein